MFTSQKAAAISDSWFTRKCVEFAKQFAKPRLERDTLDKIRCAAIRGAHECHITVSKDEYDDLRRRLERRGFDVTQEEWKLFNKTNVTIWW